MFDLGTPWWEIIVRCAVVYVALLAGLRLTGKRQLGQMAPFDLVLILLIANAVQNAMVGSDTSLVGGLLAAAVLLGANLGVSRLTENVPFLRRAVEGSPVVLVSMGDVVKGALRGQGMDLAELEQAVREHGVDGLEAVELAVLEVDGTISIVPKEHGAIRTQRRFRQTRRH